jgi:DNA-binding MarR family transcriptional regulator
MQQISCSKMVAKQQVFRMTRQERIAHALAYSGSLFLVLTLPELRRQGLSYLALYALQRVVEVADEGAGTRYSEKWLRSETGLEDYETSRACTLLLKSDLITVRKDPRDRRVRELIPTARGRKLLNRILAEAGERLWEGIQTPGRTRRVKEVTGHLRKANRILHGDFQLSFFDKDLFTKDKKRRRQSGMQKVP